MDLPRVGLVSAGLLGDLLIPLPSLDIGDLVSLWPDEPLPLLCRDPPLLFGDTRLDLLVRAPWSFPESLWDLLGDS